MSDEEEPRAEESDYEQLDSELRKSLGPEEHLADQIQDGLELEEFRDTRAGKILLGRVMRQAKNNIDLILDPNVSGIDLLNAIAELRANHRILHIFHDTIVGGRRTTRMLQLRDRAPEESGDTDV